ncbi:MAG: class II fumarate hydratase, partial [Bacteroidetes bacterium]|nr:class II fumarate hydratase [Bacteroidota bacterium]
MNFRIEKDTMGEVNVPADKYWGAQTERSRNNFQIGPEGSMPLEIVHAFAYLKKAAAHANFELGVLNSDKKELISKVCDEILTGMHDQEFPLVVWQTGSGTQSNMNCNEVIANRGHVLTGGSLLDDEKVLNPNDDVNKSQSSNDTYPTAMHIAAYKITVENTLPGLKHLRNVLQEKVVAFRDVVKTGRTP